MLAYTTTTSFQVRMPNGDLNSTLLYLLVRVRDNFDCTTQLNLSSISVIPDMKNIVSIMTTIGSPSATLLKDNDMNFNPLINTLYSGNQNDVCQVLTAVVQVVNMMAQQNIQSAIDSMFNFSVIKLVYLSV
jgi:hypothetical protein